MRDFGNKNAKRAVTLVELMLACVIALVGVGIALQLAVAVVEAAGKVRERNVKAAEGEVALERLRRELSSAQTAEATEGGVAITLEAGNKVWWGPAIQGAKQNLVRVPYPTDAAAKAAVNYAVAANVRKLTYARGARAQTVAITLEIGKYGKKREEIIRRWGTTIN